MKKQMPPFFFYSAIIMEIIIHFVIPIYKFNIIPFNYLGILIILLGLWLNLASKNRVLNNKTTIIPFEKSKKLVINGAFRYTRNPMYFGMLLMLLGEAIILNSISVFILPVIFFLIMNIKFIIPEEKLLEHTFKNEYLIYKKYVRRWV